MYESLGFEELTPLTASVILGLLLGCLYGVFAQRSALCLRRGLTGAWVDCLPALGIWVMAFASAIVGTRLAVSAGLISFEYHRFLAFDSPVVSVIVGGLLFGVGMTLAGGCPSRLTVLTGTGNLRSLFALLIFAVTALATQRGILAPVRQLFGDWTVDFGALVSFAELPGGEIWPLGLVLVAVIFSIRAGARFSHLLMASAAGLLVPLGWIGTGFFLMDDFDPIPMQSLGFTGPVSDSLFWTVAATSIPAGFGTGLVAGTILGSLVSALVSGGFQWTGLEGPHQTVRYFAGAVLLGVGGVLAGGCTIGAGLSGVSTASFTALIALVAMAVSARLTGLLIARRA